MTELRSMPAYNSGYRAGRRDARSNRRVDMGGQMIGCTAVLAPQFQAWYLGYWEGRSA
jgi:hypothetical protein